MADTNVDTIYVVERHDDDWEGPHRTRYAKSGQMAMDLAESEREEHRAEEWDLTSSDVETTVLRLIPADGNSGRVSVREAPLHE